MDDGVRSSEAATRSRFPYESVSSMASHRSSVRLAAGTEIRNAAWTLCLRADPLVRARGRYELSSAKVNAGIMGLDHLGLAVGKTASLVVLDAGNPIEAVRLRAERLCVVAKGKVVAEREKRDTTLAIKGRPATINRRHVLPRQG